EEFDFDRFDALGPFVQRLSEGAAFESQVLPDAVLDVDDIVAHVKFAKVVEGVLELLGAAPWLGAAMASGSEDLLVGDDDQGLRRENESAAEPRSDHVDRAIRGADHRLAEVDGIPANGNAVLQEDAAG